MTINDPEAFMNGFWDWEILDGCFGETRIKPTDIDGCVERKGHILMFETKRPGVSIPMGQELMFKTMVEKAKAVVIVAWGEKDEPEKLKVFSSKHPTGKEMPKGDIDELRRIVSLWYERADSSA
jgi:hypothetical protein